jgi:hypothetical protein
VLLDERGHLQTFRLGDKVSLSVPELDSCRRSLLVMAQTWRAR